MFDIGWSELLVIGVVALIVVGPKDLPVMFKTLGRFTAKARGMAREFSRAMESAADEAGVKDVAKDLKAATSSKALGLDALKDAATKFEAWDPGKPSPNKPAADKPKLTPDPAAAPPVATPASTAAAATPAPVSAKPASAPPAAPVSKAADVGPETKALADAQAAKRAAASAKAAATRAAKKAAAETPTDKQVNT
ncbi:MAG: Sec-independent protein translocase protein TatB [Gemmobacter sp.]|nr:Sec-independent protein translocase protein TatB [Gemmobacter sp.]